MVNKLVLSYKGKGDDGYRYTSVRLRAEMVEAVDWIAAQTNRSRNEIIALMLDCCMKNEVAIVDSRRLDSTHRPNV